MSSALSRRTEAIALTLSAPPMILGLVIVALADAWPRQGGGLAAVAGGSVALASSRWRTRIFAWTVAALGMIVALQVRR